MPNFDKKAASGRPAKKYNTGAPKAGSRSEGHRGFHGDAAPAKKRWNQDDRAARTGDRPASTDRRPNWEPRTERPSTARTARPSYGDRAQRTERPSYGARTERPSYGDRPARTERPSYGDRSERPSYGDRPQRGERPSYNNDRPSYGDRPARGERPSYGDRPQRSERPSYGDRPARTERPSYGDRPATNDRAPRTERPSYGDRPARTDRPSYNDRPARTDRPSYGDRPARTERPSYGDRPARSYDDRPARTERPSYNDRPARSFDDRAPRRDSDYYPAKHDTKSASFAAHEDVVLERLEAKIITADDAVGKTWKDLGIGDNMTRQLTAMGAATPFPIQAATIPDVLSGKDVLGRGKTGSGKTIAFGAPLVERLMENEGGKNRKPGRKPRALILAPTRELAMQIDRTVQPIARSVGLFTTTIVGGVPQFKQVSTLQRGVDIVIATPGRVEDLVEQGRLDLSEVMITVLDEADHMCDLGFLEPVQRILDETKKGGQKLLFSATLDKGVATLVNQYLKNPSVHEVAGEDQASSTIDHRVLLIEQRDKGRIIEELAGGEGKTLIFARTRAFAEQLADQLEDAGIPATSLHGDLNQSRRTRNLQLLTSGRVNVLVATDVAARGIHVDDISLVIQADAPDEYKTYLHRSGRTGRAGKQGTVVTLISRARRRRMDELLGRAEITAQIEPAAPGDSVIGTLAAL
ncbi:MAG: DEAD/DEAH box helicase [Lacisediminihabitans sp.]